MWKQKTQLVSGNYESMWVSVGLIYQQVSVDSSVEDTPTHGILFFFLSAQIKQFSHTQTADHECIK